MALVSRDLYYPGAKHLATIMQLLIPGIDLVSPSHHDLLPYSIYLTLQNDPVKTVRHITSNYLLRFIYLLTNSLLIVMHNCIFHWYLAIHQVWWFYTIWSWSSEPTTWIRKFRHIIDTPIFVRASFLSSFRRLKTVIPKSGRCSSQRKYRRIRRLGR